MKPGVRWFKEIMLHPVQADLIPLIRHLVEALRMPFVISYEIEDNKIVSHWLIADQVTMLEQLGIMQPA
jgi:hypothetical protein